MTLFPRSVPRTLIVASAAFLALAALAFAQSPTAAPRNRILGPIDEMDLVTLAGNMHPLARPEADRGVLADETRLERMVLLLQPDAAQQRALDALTEAQQQPASPLFHQWLTPEEYGGRFGASAGDVKRIAGWLAAHGFAVEPVSAGRRSLVFSGTAEQVVETFHTALHRYEVEGVAHIANAQDPQIPRALAQVVSGVLSLNDFRRQSATRSVRQVSAHPENTQGGAYYLFPADLATIYDLNPQYAAGKNGTGATIAIVGRSNINLSDVGSFRSYAGLTTNQPTVVLDGANPGLVSGDQDESTLDVEWSGGVAPGAAVTFVVAGSTATTDGVDLSAQYIVNHKTATVMSTSYGSCEAYMGSALSFYNSLWQQAASEGISAFVSSGDSGAAGCNSGSSSSGTMAGVNGLCSSPYSTCVGGTEFNEGANSSGYWSSSNGNGGESALSYIPEKVWNESGNDGGSGLWASTGGISIVYPQPSWQAGVAGANGNGMRTVPDVALTAASHDGYLICENGSWWVIAGTSAASPSFAGILSIVNENKGGTGQGNANPALYSLLDAAENPFHATPSGNNSVPGVTGFTASGHAYNLATGLGSVDANLLVASWPGASAPAQGVTLKPSVTSESLLPGKSATFTVAVTGTDGFTGSVALTATLPSGVTLSFSPATVKAGSSATATLTASGSAAAQSASIAITGTSGSLSASATVNLTILQGPALSLATGAASVSLVQGKSATLAVTATTGGSFTGAVTFAAAGLPSGVTATFSPASLTGSGSGSHATTLTLKAATTASLTAGTLTVTVSGDGLKATATASVQVTPAAGMSVALSTATVSMKSTASQAIVVTATPVGGASLASTAPGASFQITGLPTGITASWSAPNATASGQVQGTLTLTGSNGAVTSSTKPTVTVKNTDLITGAIYTATEQIALSVTRASIALPRPSHNF
jgi:subtilase family serine protease